MSGNYIGKVENGFYETFKKELPKFYAHHNIVYVVAECLRAAKRAEMKVMQELQTIKKGK